MDQSVGFKKRILIFQLAEELTRDFILEGWLKKMGPRNEPFKKRFFTLDKRKLMYLEEPLVNIGPLKINNQTMKVFFFLGGGDGDVAIFMLVISQSHITKFVIRGSILAQW